MENGVGGQLQGISLDSFLQMVQMEKTSCTLKVTTEEDMGWLFVLKGNLIAAETGAISGMEAACNIISWEDSVIQINNVCEKQDDEIKQPLMNVLMEGLRLRDENRAKSGGKPKPAKPPAPPQKPPEKTPEPAPKDPSEKDAKPAPKKAPRPVPADAGPEPKRRRGKLPVIAALVAVLAGGGYLAFSFFGGGSEKSYKDVIAQVEAAPDAKKIELLQSFINSREPGEQTADAQARMQTIRARVEKEELAAHEKAAEAHEAEGQMEKAISVFRHHLNKYPQSPFKAKIDHRISDISSRMEARDFDRLTQKADELGADRIDLYMEYLEKYPKGEHRADVQKRIDEMATEYFIHIEAQILDLDMKEDWDQCNVLAKKYIDIYPASRQSEQLRKLQTVWEDKVKEKRIFDTLKRSAENKGTDYAAAALIYANYLRAYPNSYMKEKVAYELARVEERINAQRLEKETERVRALLADRSDRFTENGDGTTTDKKTGLTWSTLDGLTETDDCMDYEGATAYVEALKTGGHGDWRLPTPKEMVTLYKKAPFFPETAPTWFWTSESNRRYTGQWVTDVEVVTSENSTEWKPAVRDSRACGSVRAVRGGK